MVSLIPFHLYFGDLKDEAVELEQELLYLNDEGKAEFRESLAKLRQENMAKVKVHQP